MPILPKSRKARRRLLVVAVAAPILAAAVGLSLYASRIQRNIRKNTQELNALQDARKAEEAKALEEAELLAELAESEGRTFDPQEFGFVFSAHELHKARLLTKARNNRIEAHTHRYSLPKTKKAA